MRYMKKIVTVLLATALLCGTALSVTAVNGNYHPQPNRATPGAYATGSAADFRPVGDMEIQWLPDAAARLNLRDGHLDDWADLNATKITPNNMISWVGNDDKGYNSGGEGDVDSGMPENWQTDVYFAADQDCLYMAGYVVDDTVVKGDGGSNYASGDSFQFHMDFGKRLGWIVENDPDAVSLLSNTKGVFYSFCYIGDGAEICVVRQESEDDRDLNEEDGVYGSTGLTSEGWCFEVALPWQLLFDDSMAKMSWTIPDDYLGDFDIYIDEESPLQIGMAMYYLNRDMNEDGVSGINWAAGTTQGLLYPDTNGPVVSWDAYDNGMQLYLPLQKGLEFSSPNIQIAGMVGETEVPVEDFIFNAPVVTLAPGTVVDFSMLLTPADRAAHLEYYCTDTAVAEIRGTALYAIAEGTATVMARDPATGQIAGFTLTVSEDAPAFIPETAPTASITVPADDADTSADDNGDNADNAAASVNLLAGGLLEGCMMSASAAGLATALTLLAGAVWVFKKKD